MFSVPFYGKFTHERKKKGGGVSFGFLSTRDLVACYMF